MDTVSTGKRSGRNEDIGDRKTRHLEICIDAEHYQVEFGSTGFDEMRLIHSSLPEISEAEIDTSTEFLGARVRLPLFISSMTGGAEAAYEVNKKLAAAAQQAGVPVGMGSIRILFRKPEVLPHFQLKKFAPDVPVVANIGAIQIRDVESAKIIELLKRLEVQGLAVHLNPAQELFQPEGDRDFRGILDAITRFCAICPVPVIVKETGCGVRPDEAGRLLEAGAAYVNIAGSGGTNWIAVEAYRLDTSEEAAAREFDDWGTPTALILAALGMRNGGRLSGRILASGGLRSGMDLAKALALGASLGGFALPFVRAVSSSGVEGVITLIERYERVLRAAMALTGSRTPAGLRSAPLLLSPDFSTRVRDLQAALSTGGPTGKSP
ncbi:MAG TPA: type 2 isopentenyl-diphosphate Delta-isomerase [Spirochaetia bacterium]|nr:type 2 isopentenyl-diphosphate Delta-isomerase [Spirochaetia bacterium]